MSIFKTVNTNLILRVMAICAWTTSATAALNIYSRPLYFAPADNHIDITSPQVAWDLQDGVHLSLGEQRFDSSAMVLRINQLDRSKTPRRYRESGRGDGPILNLGFSWPEKLSPVGRLVAIDRNSKTLWSDEITVKKIRAWHASLEDDDLKLLAPLKTSTYGALDVDKKAMPFLQNGREFRLCLSRIVSANEKFRACSPVYKFAANQLQVAQQEARGLKVDGHDSPSAGVMDFAKNQSSTILAIFDNGATLQITTKPRELKFIDVIKNPDGTTFNLTGEGAKPIGKVENVVVPSNHFWAPTGLGQKVVWRMSLPIDKPQLQVAGAWNIPFTFTIKFDKLPEEQDRLWVRINRSPGTYSKLPWVYGQVTGPSQQVSSSEVDVKLVDQNHFKWTFLATKAGEWNSARIKVRRIDDPDATDWIAHDDLYRGYPTELSLRLTGLLSLDLKTVLVGEVAASYWLETLLGIDSYYLSEQRWGISARYFDALTPLQVPTGTRVTPYVNLYPFTTTNVDLHYNLNPGIWNRDQLYGLIGSLYNVQIQGGSQDTAMFAGMGAYWARTMPKIFDDIFNFLPGFKYPKYVDTEFIYYPISLTSTSVPGVTYSLNFHGKVFWTKTFYGEAGFGVRAYNYTANSGTINQETIALSTVFGTVGLGVIF